MTLIKCEINIILTWSKGCVISSATGNTKFKMTDAKLYLPFVTLSTQNNAELLEQLKSGFKRRVDWNKYHPKIFNRKTKSIFRFLN